MRELDYCKNNSGLKPILKRISLSLDHKKKIETLLAHQ